MTISLLSVACIQAIRASVVGDNTNNGEKSVLVLASLFPSIICRHAVCKKATSCTKSNLPGTIQRLAQHF